MRSGGALALVVNSESKKGQTASCSSLPAKLNGNNLLQHDWLTPQRSVKYETISGLLRLSGYTRLGDVQHVDGPHTYSGAAGIRSNNLSASVPF
jgi:hypothetical protein